MTLPVGVPILLLLFKRFVVNSCMNQLLSIDRVKSPTEPQNELFVQWSFGNLCNWACEYCPPYLHNASFSWPSYESATNFLTNLFTHIKQSNNTMRLDFLGGEVTLCKYFPEILQLCWANNTRTSIITNGSRTKRYWSEILPFLSIVNFTYHPQHSDFTHYKEIIGMAIKENCKVFCQFAAVPQYMDDINSYAEELISTYNHDVVIIIKPLFDKINQTGNHYYKYSKEHLDNMFGEGPGETIKDQILTYADGTTKLYGSNEVLSYKLNNFKGMYCEIGTNLIVIDMSGNIRTGVCPQSKIIGNISDTVFTFPTDPVQCNQNLCLNPLNLYVAKRASTGKY